MFRFLVILVISLFYVSNANSQQCGGASYYAGKFHGRKTASGEKFNMHNMTAAHKTLKFGTVVKVIDQKTGKEITVKINDRGPYVKGRIIDLSKESAKKLGIVHKGHAKVCIYDINNEKKAKKMVEYDFENLTDKAMRKRKNEFIENVTQDVVNRTKGSVNKKLVKKYINQKFNKMFKGEI